MCIKIKQTDWYKISYDYILRILRLLILIINLLGILILWKNESLNLSKQQ